MLAMLANLDRLCAGLEDRQDRLLHSLRHLISDERAAEDDVNIFSRQAIEGACRVFFCFDPSALRPDDGTDPVCILRQPIGAEDENRIYLVYPENPHQPVFPSILFTSEPPGFSLLFYTVEDLIFHLCANFTHPAIPDRRKFIKRLHDSFKLPARSN
jgi:hypothetical protein